MIVTTTEVQNNFGKYLKLAEKEDIIITRNGKKAARLVKYADKDDQDYHVREKGLSYNYNGREITYEQFKKISEESDNRYEYIDGKIYLLSSPSFKHQIIIREIFAEFISWFKAKDCEPLTSPFDITLYRDEDNINVVQPDIVVICDTENIDNESKYNGIPSLVVEVLSKTTSNHDFIQKLDLYRASGIKEYWIVDPFSKQINIYHFTEMEIDKMLTYKMDEIVSSIEFEGLEIDVNQVFVDLG